MTEGQRDRAGKVRLRTGAVAVALAMATPAAAGPPFVTDDPAPPDVGHWEIYGFVSGARIHGETNGDGGVEFNYGAGPDLQLSLELPVAYERSVGSRMGFGDVEAAVKYRWLHQAADGLSPDVAFYPGISMPTASRRTAAGRWTLSLPMWAQKDFGAWSLFGGGGYTLNPGGGNRNYWSGGLAAQRQVSERLALGAEIYHHTADAVGAQSFTGMNLGATFRVGPHWSVLAAGGPGLQHPGEGGRYAFYAALKADF